MPRLQEKMEFTRENGKVIKRIWHFNVYVGVGWGAVVRSSGSPEEECLGPLWEAVPRKCSRGEQPAQQGSNEQCSAQLEPVTGKQPTSRLYGLGLSLQSSKERACVGLCPGSSTCQVLRELAAGACRWKLQ